MQSTCPRCGNPRIVSREGPALPCPSCGFTALVVSARPRSTALAVDPLWGPALATCVGVSVLVFLGALAAARVASAAPQAASDQLTQTRTPACRGTWFDAAACEPSAWSTRVQTRSR